MPFSTASPACVSSAVSVVDDARSMDWSTSDRLSPPTYLLSNDSLPESEEDDLVIIGTRAVQRRFLDNEGEIELMGEKNPSNREVESEVDLEEAKEVVKDEVEEKEPDKEWRATGTWPSQSNNKGEEWGWGGNAQLMANDSCGPADPVTLDSLDSTPRTVDWNIQTIDGNVLELVRRACHQARAARDHHVSSILVETISSVDFLLVFPSPSHPGSVCSDESYGADVAGQSAQHPDGSSHWSLSDRGPSCKPTRDM